MFVLEETRSNSVNIKPTTASKTQLSELQLCYSFPPTSLMIGAVLALTAAVLCLVQTFTRKEPKDTESKKLSMTLITYF